MKVDILVVSYHAKKELAMCLASLALYSAPDYRLTVHDNTAVNYPLTWLWNRFAERSKSEFLAFVNSDVIVGPGWDTEAFALMNSDGKIAAASPLSNYPPHEGFAKIPHPGEDALDLVLQQTEKLKQSPTRFYKGANRTLVAGHCMILRRAAFKAVAGFDEKWSFANNDWDMNHRMVKVGYSLGVCLHAVSLHWINASTRDARSKGLIRGNPIFVKPKPGATFDSLGCAPLVRHYPGSAVASAPRNQRVMVSPKPTSAVPMSGLVNSPSVKPIKH